MDALGIYAQRFQDHFFSLPTESFRENASTWNLIDPETIGGIVDAAAIGQYLLGVDPIHCRWKPCRNGFINENCRVDFGAVNFIVENSKIFRKYCFVQR